MIAAFSLVVLSAKPSPAQDLFELEVFDYDGVAPGGYEMEIHANALSRGSRSADSTAANHRPGHLSVELTRGWSERFETALFVQTAPFGPSGSTWFAGGHVRTKIRLGEIPSIPLRLAMSAEYGFNRPMFDRELQTFELRSIVDYENGRLSLVFNPSLEMVTRGSDDGLEPVFDLSAHAAWQLVRRLAVTGDYFSAAADTRHLAPEVSAHHLVLAGVSLDVGSMWELNASAGHCITSSEPWLLKSIIGFRF